MKRLFTPIRNAFGWLWWRITGLFARPKPPPEQIFTAGVAGVETEENYSRDREWMLELVLIAKNTYVWLDQLSKKYDRSINTLDQIPDEELRLLADWGFNGLWLIGLWQRSPVSKKIKQLTGNAEAVASAYSLLGYRIANDLGGEAALDDLRQRAGRHGIRLACDMVPNHTGIDAPWVLENPDWFVGLDDLPYENYSFTGPDLMENGQVAAYLEDGYLDQGDAAVVFKRVERATGRTRYIYHGNDGVGSPWNDTAQLDYLNPEVREAVTEEIIRVARQFPVIRFDAAMALANQHIHRLWYPPPGTRETIPSRPAHGLTSEEFASRMPREFWRDVVLRLAEEAPDTMLLAEAFWLMEGRFIRSFGFHRVYNSAFMHMLKDEDNAKFRALIKNALAFDPRILPRLVNFMTNPDEETAIAQFGGDDKYFGVCTLLAALPGTPMFGHGQFEGLHERYGMDFKQARLEETSDAELVARHERQIVSLLKRRRLFAAVDDFFLYDLVTPSGQVDENVIAFSNQHGGQRALIVYNNSARPTAGVIRSSVPYVDKPDRSTSRQTSLAAALQLSPRENRYTIFKDHVSSLERIFDNKDLTAEGLPLKLEPYQTYVLLDIQQVDADTANYRLLVEELNGAGVPSIAAAIQEMVDARSLSRR